jgi:hypothetical protein
MAVSDTTASIPVDSAAQLAEASRVLDRLVAPDPEKTLAERIAAEFADFRMVVEHCSAVYSGITNGLCRDVRVVPKVILDWAQENTSDATGIALIKSQMEIERLEKQIEELKARLQDWYASQAAQIRAADAVRIAGARAEAVTRPWFAKDFGHEINIIVPEPGAPRCREYLPHSLRQVCEQQDDGTSLRTVYDLTVSNATQTIFRGQYMSAFGSCIYATFTIDGRCRYVGKSLMGISRPLGADHLKIRDDPEWSVLLFWRVDVPDDKALLALESQAIKLFQPALTG